MTDTILARVRAAVAAGRPREATELLARERPALSADLVVVAAEAWAASGAERRAAALLSLATRALPDDRTLAVEAARALLRRGQHRRAARALERHAAGAPLLFALANRQPVPTDLPVVGDEETIDRSLAMATSTADLVALLARVPTSARLRVAVAARHVHEGRRDEARAVLRAGLKGREDARLELALGFIAVDDGAWDEAAMVIARARARARHLSRDPALGVLVALVTVAAGRRTDALSLLHGAGPRSALGALQALLHPAAAPAASVAQPSAAPASTTPTTRAPSSAPPAMPRMPAVAMPSMPPVAMPVVKPTMPPVAMPARPPGAAAHVADAAPPTTTPVATPTTATGMATSSPTSAATPSPRAAATMPDAVAPRVPSTSASSSAGRPVDGTMPVAPPTRVAAVVAQPVVAQPVVAQPVIAQPVVAQPIVAQPVVAQPVIAQSVVAQPVIAQPVVAQPVVAQPIVAQPTVAQPVVEQPVVAQLVVAQPVVAQPIVAQPVVEQPVVEQPVVEQPVVEQPVVEQPVVEQPVVEQPVVAQPVVEQPVVEQPVIEQPVAEQPMVAQTVVEQPVGEQPLVTAPATARTAAADASPQPPPKTWRRPNERPVEEARGSPFGSLGLIAAALLLVGVVVVPKVLHRDDGNDPDRGVVDAGVADAPPGGPTAFAERLQRCGLKVEPWVDVGVTTSAWGIAAARGMWQGRPANLARLATTIDPAVQSGARMYSTRTGGPIEPHAVTSIEGDRVVGFALQATTPTDRPLVRDVVGGVAFDVATARACPAGGAERVCVVGTARCEALVFRVQGLCPTGASDAAALPACLFDLAVATDPAVASGATTTP